MLQHAALHTRVAATLSPSRRRPAELERRAKIAGSFLAPFLAAVPAGQDTPLFVFSHSLGTFTTAHMAQRLYSPAQGDVGGRVRHWFAAASAVPATAFTPGSGIFDRAPRLVTSDEGPAISVLYSNLDSVRVRVV